MKPTKLITILITVFSLLIVSEGFSQKKPKEISQPKVFFNKVKFLNTNVNFDNFVAGKSCVGLIMFINISDQPLRIRETTQDCSCYTVAIQSKVIQPGEKGIINYTLSNPSFGKLNKKSFIFFDNINTPVPITITGTFISKS